MELTASESHTLEAIVVSGGSMMLAVGLKLKGG
jgi:hypothetical protein